MQSVEIYLNRNGTPVGQLPYPDSIDYLESRAREHPRLVGEYRSLIQRLQQLSAAGEHTIKMVPSEINRSERLHLQQLLGSLIFRNIGALYCSQCRDMIEAERLIFEEFKRGRLAEKSVSGKRFYCNHNHMLFEHLDIKF